MRSETIYAAAQVTSYHSTMFAIVDDVDEVVRCVTEVRCAQVDLFFTNFVVERSVAIHYLKHDVLVVRLLPQHS